MHLCRHVHLHNPRGWQVLQRPNEGSPGGDGALNKDGVEVVVGIGTMQDACYHLHHPSCAATRVGHDKGIALAAAEDLLQSDVGRRDVGGGNPLEDLERFDVVPHSLEATARETQKIEVLRLALKCSLHEADGSLRIRLPLFKIASHVEVCLRAVCIRLQRLLQVQAPGLIVSDEGARDVHKEDALQVVQVLPHWVRLWRRPWHELRTTA
mmetsp:Transcript_6445/g.13235  ORF Transcript_6445/g.13235 Transcript_6445/m.13235 type:complete len:210 (-) Transcript_6445:567-1196(-)